MIGFIELVEGAEVTLFEGELEEGGEDGYDAEDGKETDGAEGAVSEFGAVGEDLVEVDDENDEDAGGEDEGVVVEAVGVVLVVVVVGGEVEGVVEHVAIDFGHDEEEDDAEDGGFGEGEEEVVVEAVGEGGEAEAEEDGGEDGAGLNEAGVGPKVADDGGIGEVTDGGEEEAIEDDTGAIAGEVEGIFKGGEAEGGEATVDEEVDRFVDFTAEESHDDDNRDKFGDFFNEADVDNIEEKVIKEAGAEFEGPKGVEEVGEDEGEEGGEGAEAEGEEHEGEGFLFEDVDAPEVEEPHGADEEGTEDGEAGVGDVDAADGVAEIVERLALVPSEPSLDIWGEVEFGAVVLVKGGEFGRALLTLVEVGEVKEGAGDVAIDFDFAPEGGLGRLILL